VHRFCLQPSCTCDIFHDDSCTGTQVRMRWITQDYPQSLREGFVGRAFSKHSRRLCHPRSQRGGPSENKTFHVEALQKLMGFNWTHFCCKAVDFFSWRSLKLRKSISWVAFRPINLIGTPPVWFAFKLELSIRYLHEWSQYGLRKKKNKHAQVHTHWGFILKQFSFVPSCTCNTLRTPPTRSSTFLGSSNGH